MLSPDARGVQELAFTASDPNGPGVYEVTAQINGKPLYSGTPDNNDGKCVPVGNSGGVLMFDYSQPCRPSESVDLPINTTSVADGQHTLKITVEDAAQNSSVVYDSTITTKNAPADSSPPTILTPSQTYTGDTLSAHPGTWEAPAGAGTITYKYQWESCDNQGNNCKTIAGAQNETYTPTPADIAHTVRLIVNASDNDGTTPAVSEATSTVLTEQNTPGAPPSPNPGTGTSTGPSSGTGTGTGPSPGTGPGTSTVAPAAIPTTVGSASTPNGTNASEAATIHLGIRHAISRSFAHRALKIPGQLLNNHGYPISAAELDVLQQTADSTTVRIIAHTRTNANGIFLVSVPAGPSRLIQIAYRAFSTDTNYTATQKITESVDAGVRLKVAPHQTSSNGTIVLTGQVLGPVPPQGAIVHLLVHYHGHWQPFRTPRTDPYGHFEDVYQFQGGIGRFPIKATVPAGQTDFPFTSGHSNVVNVTTG